MHAHPPMGIYCIYVVNSLSIFGFTLITKKLPVHNGYDTPTAGHPTYIYKGKDYLYIVPFDQAVTVALYNFTPQQGTRPTLV